MKNTGRLFTRLGIAVVAASFLASCSFNGIKGSGNVTTENRPVTGNFKSIQAGNGLEVFLEQSDTPSITVEADDNVQKHISTKIVNEVLIISSDCNNYTNVTKKILVKMPVIAEIDVSSGANLISKNTLKGNAITVNASSGADIKIAIEAEKAICESSSGSHIDIDGKAMNLETASSSGSNIDAANLISNAIIASASSGSTTDVHPLVSLNAEASSGGNVNYHHIPKNLSKNSSSGGSINQR